MLNIYRRHLAGCANHGKRTRGKPEHRMQVSIQSSAQSIFVVNGFI
jgi:hypothetical protein